MNLTQDEREILNFVLKGKIRSKILLSINNNIKSPTDIAKEINIHLSSVCRAVNSLVTKEIIIPLSLNKNGNNFYRINDIKFTTKLNEIFRNKFIQFKNI